MTGDYLISYCERWSENEKTWKKKHKGGLLEVGEMN